MAFNKGVTREDALDILLDMEDSNTDGFGFGYVVNGQFHGQKWKKSLTKVLRDKRNKVFEHLKDGDFSGWTLAHVRAASKGIICKANSHPFVVGNYLGVHNGHWPDSDLVRAAMGGKYTSATDSEVAMNLINKVGIKKFSHLVNYGGVFLMLNKSGCLHIAKVSGDLTFAELEDKSTLISSELDDEEFENQVEAEQGWYIFNAEGRLVQNWEKYKKSGPIDCSNIPDAPDVLDSATETLANPYSRHSLANLTQNQREFIRLSILRKQHNQHVTNYGGWHEYD